MSDSEEMRWDLEAEKILKFSVGWGASPFFRKLDALNMFWHAARGVRDIAPSEASGGSPL